MFVQNVPPYACLYRTFTCFMDNTKWCVMCTIKFCVRCLFMFVQNVPPYACLYRTFTCLMDNSKYCVVLCTIMFHAFVVCSCLCKMFHHMPACIEHLLASWTIQNFVLNYVRLCFIRSLSVHVCVKCSTICLLV